MSSYYVASPKRNSIVNLGYRNGVSYYKKGATVVWFVDENGLIAIIEPHQFENIAKVNHLKFRYFDSKQGIEELKNILGV